MRCGGCGEPLGAPGGRVVSWADSPTGTSQYVCGACGSQMSLGTFRDMLGDDVGVGHDEPLEPSWEPCDNAPGDRVADRRSADVLECLQARVGFGGDHVGAVITRLVERSDWN